MNNNPQKPNKKWKEIGERFTPINTFLLMMSVSFAIVLIASLFSKGGAFSSLFFLRGGDLFMDFFNSVRDSAQGAQAYSVRWIIYPPMADALFIPFSVFLPDWYLQTTFEDRLTWPQFSGAWVAIILFLFLTAAVLFLACYRPRSFARPTAILLGIFAILNVPALYALERGNIILLSTAAIIFYISAYNSQNKLVRELSLVALAFAFSIKLYPIAFAWLLLVDKRIKDAIRCVVWGLFMIVAPTVFFGGPLHSLSWLLKNTLGFSTDKIGNANGASWHLWMQNGAFSIPYYVIFALALACFLLVCFIRRSDDNSSSCMKNWIFLIALIMAFPPIQGLYAATLLFAPLLMLLKENKWTPWNLVYFSIIVLIFLPIPFRILNLSFNETAFPILSLLLLFACSADAVIFLKDHFKKKREVTVTSENDLS